MQVTKQEIHRIWAGLKEQLYTQDVAWINKQVDAVITYTSRLLSLHHRDNFLTHFQAEDLRVGEYSRIRRRNEVLLGDAEYRDDLCYSNSF